MPITKTNIKCFDIAQYVDQTEKHIRKFYVFVNLPPKALDIYGLY